MNRTDGRTDTLDGSVRNSYMHEKVPLGEYYFHQTVDNSLNIMVSWTDSISK